MNSALPRTAGDRRDLRVLHAPVEIAGQAALSAYGLREIGVQARSFARPHPFAYPVAPDIQPGPARVEWLRAATAAVKAADVIHFYFGESFLPRWLKAADARALGVSGRRVIVEFMGSDIRLPTIEAQRNPFYVRLDGEDDRKGRALMATWSRITGGHVIINDPALHVFVRDYFAHVHTIPVRVDVARFAASPPSTVEHKPVVVHAPSDLAGKGTRYVRAAVERLCRHEAALDYIELTNRRSSDVADVLRRADVVVDQLCSGSHGVLAAEAMSMAKPVICYIHDDVIPLYPPDLPVIRATPETITEVLRDWLLRPRALHDRGVASRRYAEQTHDVRAVAHRLLDVYMEIGR